MERLEKRLKKPNFSYAEVAKLVEMVSFEQNTLMSSSQDNATKRGKQEIWQRIADAVNAIGGHSRSEQNIRKKWKDLKTAALKKPTHVTVGDGGDSVARTTDHHLSLELENLILNIIQEGSQNKTEPPEMTLELDVIDESSLCGDASFPEGTVIQVQPIELDGAGYELTGHSAVNGADTASDGRTATTTTTSSRPPNTPCTQRAAPKAMKMAFQSRRQRPARRAAGGATGPTSPIGSAASEPCGTDSDEVWVQWMQSEISKNEVKQQLMVEQFKMVRQQRSLIELQKKELVLKIKGLEQLQKKNFVSQFDSHSDLSE